MYSHNPYQTQPCNPLAIRTRDLPEDSQGIVRETSPLSNVPDIHLYAGAVLRAFTCSQSGYEKGGLKIKVDEQAGAPMRMAAHKASPHCCMCQWALCINTGQVFSLGLAREMTAILSVELHLCFARSPY